MSVPLRFTLMHGLDVGPKMAIRKLIRRFIFGKALFDLRRIQNAFPHAVIRKFQDLDFDSCRQLYVMNEKGRFPEGCVQEFERNLRDENTLSLVAEVDGELVATGGISIHEYSDEIQIATISFGLIHPKFHNKGLGMMLLVFRLSLLPLDRDMWSVAMTSAGNGTERFFKNIGFLFADRSVIEPGIEVDNYYLRLPKSDIRRFRKRFLKSEVKVIGDARTEIPHSDRRDEYEKHLAQQAEALKA